MDTDLLYIHRPFLFIISMTLYDNDIKQKKREQDTPCAHKAMTYM